MKTGRALFEHAIQPSGIKIAEDNPANPERHRLFGEAVFTSDGKTLVFCSDREAKERYEFNIFTADWK